MKRRTDGAARRGGFLRRRAERRRRIQVEDALKHIHAAEEQGRTATLESLAGSTGRPSARVARLASRLQELGLIEAGEGLVLTSAGRRWARQIVRAHRVLETWLASQLAHSLKEIHRRAHRREHDLTPEEIDGLAARLGHPTVDPHGDPIPTATGTLHAVESSPLTVLPENVPLEIRHLEDEPEAIYERLVDAGLAVGQVVRVGRLPGGRLRVRTPGREVELSPVDAANVFAATVEATAAAGGVTLAELAPGEDAVVRSLESRGLERRRLMDLGVTEGAKVECLYRSSFGEPTAYRVRGTVVALRPDQARRIRIGPPAPGGNP
ncbi:MAG: FeoA domain-containing protein [Gemmatimonadota bacterium]